MRKWREKKMVTRKADNHRRHPHHSSYPPYTHYCCHLWNRKNITKGFYNILPLVYWLKNVSKSNYSALLLTANDEVHTHTRSLTNPHTASHNNHISTNDEKKKVIVEQKPSENNLLFQKQLQKTFTLCRMINPIARILLALLLLLSKHVTFHCAKLNVLCMNCFRLVIKRRKKPAQRGHTVLRQRNECKTKKKNERELKDIERKICTKLHYFPLDTISKMKMSPDSNSKVMHTQQGL